jgi:hypothetical protein
LELTRQTSSLLKPQPPFFSRLIGSLLTRGRAQSKRVFATISTLVGIANPQSLSAETSRPRFLRGERAPLISTALFVMVIRIILCQLQLLVMTEMQKRNWPGNPNDQVLLNKAKSLESKLQMSHFHSHSNFF